jgi:AcrR family transcriptional regulator
MAPCFLWIEALLSAAVVHETVVLRADAARNRRALIDTARETFGRRGLDAPLDEIARQAGIGNATLYRHFPTRQDLIAAVYADAVHDIVAACDRALEEPDPWAAFAGHVMFVCRLQAESRGLADLLTTRINTVPELERLRARAYRGFERLADRAKDNGSLRHDFQPEDLAVLMMANAGLIHRTATEAPRAWTRLVSFVLDGLRQEAAVGEAPPSPGLRAVRAAMAAGAGVRRCS